MLLAFPVPSQPRPVVSRELIGLLDPPRRSGAAAPDGVMGGAYPRPEDADTMRSAARWLAGLLAFAGGRVAETAGHPVVRGEWLGADGAPTILVYGHQPGECRARTY